MGAAIPENTLGPPSVDIQIYSILCNGFAAYHFEEATHMIDFLCVHQ